MSSSSNYSFYNLSRIEDDPTCETQRSMQNTRFSSYTTSNYFSGLASNSQIQFATSQPAILPNGTFSGSGVGSNVDIDSLLSINTEQERSLGRLQLLQRPFLTVPYLGRGSCDPNLESQLFQGEAVSDKKSVSTVMSQSFMGYTLYPTSSKMEEHVKDTKYTVEESALDGWIRGGAATREMADDPYFNKTHRPTDGSY
jgi:hypothetical protein